MADLKDKKVYCKEEGVDVNFNLETRCPKLINLNLFITHERRNSCFPGGCEPIKFAENITKASIVYKRRRPWLVRNFGGVHINLQSPS